MTPAMIRSWRRRLLAWYRAGHRTLPWRAEPGVAVNPYHVLVSEFMLQQTQVATVIAYFQRFTARWPTVQALAAAREKEVLTLWQGLGYYSRARNLLRAARVIVTRYGGQLPGDVDALRQLPGVGRYTAGALASIALGQRAAVVDGNVLRVLARVLAVTQPVDCGKTRAQMWAIAEKLVPGKYPGKLIPGEFIPGEAHGVTPWASATRVFPGGAGAKCAVCPLAKLCLARQRGWVDRLPVKRKRVRPRAVEHHILAVECAGRWLLEQRAAHGLWARMWQFPTTEKLPPGATAQQIHAWGRNQLGQSVAQVHEVERFTHQITHRTVHFVLWRGRVARQVDIPTGTWRKLNDLNDLPLANPQRQAARAMGSV